MRKKFTYYVYILTNAYNTTFYIGVTNNIVKRLFEHKTGLIDGFTKKYRVKKLVHLEEYNNIAEAIRREKQLKNWHRDWKESGTKLPLAYPSNVKELKHVTN